MIVFALRGNLRMRAARVYWDDAVRLLWQPIRLAILALLVILEPVIAFLLGGFALLGVFTTILFKFIGAPHFPFWTMLAISILFVALLALYEALINLLSRPIV